MMDERSSYRVSAWWTSGKAGIAKTESAPTVIHFTAPPSFGGDPGRWNPEEMMLAALGACFTTTFQALATYSHLPYTDMEVEVRGEVEKTTSGYQFTSITISPKVTIEDEQQRGLADKVLRKSEALCLVSRALSTPKKFAPVVLVSASPPSRGLVETSNAAAKD
jgi:peroxiredoxin-like protein